jgi:hypothetical protein
MAVMMLIPECNGFGTLIFQNFMWGTEILYRI